MNNFRFVSAFTFYGIATSCIFVILLVLREGIFGERVSYFETLFAVCILGFFCVVCILIALIAETGLFQPYANRLKSALVIFSVIAYILVPTIN